MRKPSSSKEKLQISKLKLLWIVDTTTMATDSATNSQANS